MLELKKDAQVWVPVRLIDSAGAPVTGLAYSDVICSVLKADGTEASVTVNAMSWFEATTGALAGVGVYRIRLSAAAVSVAGFLTYAVQDDAVPPNIFVGVADVVAYLESDTVSAVTRALGLLHENSVLDLTTFTGDDNLLSGRLRTYDSKANAEAASAASPTTYDTGKTAEYSITASYSGTALLKYKVSREA